MTATMTETTADATEPEAPRTIDLSAAELAATRVKFAALADRAARKGFTGGLSLTVGEAVTYTEQDEHGFDVTRTVYPVSVSGTAPSYGGWSFLSRLEVLESGAVVPFNAPGVDAVNIGDLDPRTCSHCRTDRYRKNLYVVADAAGTRQVVGSTCIKDFLGWSASPVFLSTDEILSDLEQHVRGARIEPTYDVGHVLAVAYAATRAYGFVRSGDFDKVSTKARVNFVLNPPRRMTADDRAEHADMLALAAEANEQAAVVRAWILSDDFAGSSDYVSTLKTLCAEVDVTSRMFGFLASAPAAMDRATAKAAEVAAAKLIPAAPVPVTDARVTVTGEIVWTQWEQGYGYNSPDVLKITVRDDRGFRVSGTAASSLGAVEKGDRVTFDAKVKPGNRDETRGYFSRPTKATKLG